MPSAKASGGVNERARVFNLTPFKQNNVASFLRERYDFEVDPRVKSKYKSSQRAELAFKKATAGLPDNALVLVGGNKYIHHYAVKSDFIVCIPNIENGVLVDMSVME